MLVQTVFLCVDAHTNMFVWLDCIEVYSLFLFRNGLATSRPIRSLRGISQRYWEGARLECH